MKLGKALVRTSKVDEAIRALEDAGAPGITIVLVTPWSGPGHDAWTELPVRPQEGDEMSSQVHSESKIVTVLSLAFGLIALYAAGTASGAPRNSAARGIPFTDARKQAAEFIKYDDTIKLTPEQQKVMQKALSSMPAPCCAQYSMATCCCPCNFAKSVWGLSKILITKYHYDTPRVEAAAREWIEFTNPSGYTGDACFTGGCERAFDHNGCGGMDARRIS